MSKVERVLLEGVKINSSATFTCDVRLYGAAPRALKEARRIATTKRDVEVELRQIPDGSKTALVLNVWGQDGEEAEPTREWKHGKFMVVSEP